MISREAAMGARLKVLFVLSQLFGMFLHLFSSRDIHYSLRKVVEAFAQKRQQLIAGRYEQVGANRLGVGSEFLTDCVV